MSISSLLRGIGAMFLRKLHACTGHTMWLIGRKNTGVNASFPAMCAANVPAQAPAAPVPNVVVPPAVSEVPIMGTSSLFDIEVTPMWPAKPGVYVRGAHTREVGLAQFNRISGGARCVSALLCTIHSLACKICLEHVMHGILCASNGVGD